MTDHSLISACPDCGTPLPPDSPQALCPACLMRQALASRTIVDGDPRASASLPFSPEEIADKFPGFEILECLGRGGMGVVYKARQKSLNRIIAIKILAPERGGETRFAERFAREAEMLAKLNHPHIVTIHDFGVTDFQLSTINSQLLYYLVMEFVDGVNLRDLIRDGKLEAKQALAIIPPICDALQYAHDKGIVHRDIKPENLLLDKDGRIKIADFGIASLMGEAGEIAGTPPYMAPEQTGGNTDHRADIYALGVVLYEMLTGERPDKELIAPSRKVQIDVRLDEVVLRALERKPELRFQQATALKTSLEIIANQDTSERSAPKMTSHPVPLAWTGYEYRSTKTLLGLPLLHVAQGLDPLTGQPRHARGIIAIGGVATGWLAMGGRAYGIIAFGGIAVGVLALGGVAIGMVSVGGLTLALVLALGGMAIAPFALGGMAIGYLAMGGQAIGVHVVDGRNPDMAWLHKSYRAYQAWLFGGLGSIWMFLLGFSACISAWAKSRALGDRDHSHASNRIPRSLEKWALGLFIGAVVVFLLLWGFMGAKEVVFISGSLLTASLALALMNLGKRTARAAAVFSLLALCGLALIVASNRVSSHSFGSKIPQHEIPEGYEGFVVMVYGFPGVMSQTFAENGSYQYIRYPDDGIVIASSEPRFGVAANRTLAEYKNSSLETLPKSSGWLRSERWGSRVTHDGIQFNYMVMAVGSEAYWRSRNENDIEPKLKEAEAKIRAHVTDPRNKSAFASAGEAGPVSRSVVLPKDSGSENEAFRIESGKQFALPKNDDPASEEKTNGTSTAESMSIDQIKAITNTNQFLDLELAVIDAKANGLGDNHPSVIVAADILARFKKTHSEIPNAILRQLVGQRLEKAREQLATFVQNGLGNEHPVMVVQKARIRTLTDMLREPE